MNSWIAFEMFINILQAALIVYFVHHRFHITKHERRYPLLACLAISTYLNCYLFFDIPVTDTLVFIIPLLYSFCISDNKWYVIFFWNAVLTAVFLGVVTLVINIFLLLTNASLEQIVSETPLRVSYVVSCNIAILLAVFIICRLFKHNEPIPLSALIVFIVMIIAELVIIETLFYIRFENHDRASLFATASICILICATLSLLLFELMSSSIQKQRRYEAELKTTKMTHEHYKEMKDMYSYIVSYQHDAAKQYDLIKHMVECDQSGEGYSYFQRITRPRILQAEFMTGCIAVDALLTVKKLSMDRNNIKFTFQPYPLQSLPICENDFCLILSNLLDNAIEAIQRIEVHKDECKVSLSFARSWDMFFIVCENDMRPSSIRREGSSFISSKPDSNKHGYGTKSIKSIVDAANGQCSFIVKEAVFRAVITLPYEEGNI